MKLEKENVFIDLREYSKEQLQEIYVILVDNHEGIYPITEHCLEHGIHNDEYPFLVFYESWHRQKEIRQQTKITIEQLRKFLQGGELSFVDLPKQYAIALRDEFLPMMYCYIGSGMLTNDYDEKTANDNAVNCAIISVTKLMEGLTVYGRKSDELQNMDRTFAYYDNVIAELRKMK